MYSKWEEVSGPCSDQITDPHLHCMQKKEGQRLLWMETRPVFTTLDSVFGKRGGGMHNVY